MQPSPQRVPLVQFGDFTLDAEQCELRRGNQLVPLQEKPFQLLSLLAAKPGRTVTREEIRQKLWGGDTFVEFDDNLNHAVKKLREALGDSADAPRFIKTLPRHGYRFLVEVHPAGGGPPAARERGWRWGMFAGFGTLLLFASAVLLTLARRESLTAPTSLLVLPFRALDDAARQGRIGEGISEQVTAKLMNLDGLRLISPDVACRVSTAGASPESAGRRLNAEAVLIGSVRTAERKIRVNAQLIRTADGRILWAGGGLELEARDLLEAESVFATAIAGRLRGALTSRERTMMARAPTSNAEAYEFFLRGKLAMRGQREDRLTVAEQLFDQAVHLDPAFAEALAWLALAQAGKFTNGSAGDQVRRASIENARKAIAIDPSVATARRALINIFHTTGQAEEGLREAARLRQFSPGDAVALSAIATAYVRAGMPDRAVPLYKQALEMDPEDSDTLGELSFAAYWAGQYELGRRVLEGQPPEVAPLPRMNLAVSTGRREMAHSAALQLMRKPMSPLFSVVLGGLCLRDLGEGELARRILRERLPVFQHRSANLRNERLQIGLGLSYAFIGNKQRARDQIRLALEDNPGDPWASFYSAEIHAQLGENRQAIEYLRQAIDRGFLSHHFLDWRHFRLYQLRDHPEVRAFREELSAKIAALRKQY
ncbi:MAG: winged helix-turn-helix domain-containing protein [Bryobacteraceae bacterium]